MVGSNVGKYRVLDRVGRGGMGTVYRAVDETLYREVAIKVLNADLDDPEVAKRFRAEAITVARLSHPGIATIYELFQHEGQWLMVMEFVRGETLERMAEATGGLSPQRAAEFCMQALTALAHAHSMGVVHRDLKPANLMITETGTIKIMDFGIARVAGAEHLTNVGFTMGTPAYMAPEQVMGTDVDARADLYAMGVVFYRLTVGKLPFKGETPFAMAQSHVSDPPTPVSLFRTDLPPWVESIVTKALAKSPDDRFQSSLDFYDAFARCLAGLPMRSASAATRTDSLMTQEAAATIPALRPPTGYVPDPLPRPGTQPIDLEATRMSGAVGAVGAGVLDESAATTLAPIKGQPAAVIARDRKRNAIVLSAAVVLVLVGVAVGGVVWTRARNAARQAAETPPLPEAPSAVQAPSPPVPEPSTPPDVPIPSTTASNIPAATAPAPTTPAPNTSAPRAGRADATAAARSSDVPAPVAPATNRGSVPVAATPEPPVDDAHQAFADTKMLIVSGTKTDDPDVVLSFVAGQISVLGKSSGSVLRIMPYNRVVRATYVRARDPKWDKSLPGPPSGLDVGSFMRTAKPWLVLQTSDAFVILKLDDHNVANVLETLEARIHMTVDRPTSSDK
jgi:Protein kinase domain